MLKCFPQGEGASRHILRVHYIEHCLHVLCRHVVAMLTALNYKHRLPPAQCAVCASGAKMVFLWFIIKNNKAIYWLLCAGGKTMPMAGLIELPRL